MRSSTSSTILHNLPLLFVLLACGSSAPAREFDGRTAFTYVERQMGFGPRIPGTPGHVKMGDWLLAELRARADTVIVQDIAHVSKKGETVHMRNFFARFHPAATERVLYLAHWDTRPRSERSANLGQRQLPLPGANDGASGVAVLLGVADVLKKSPTRATLGVDLLFVDGEDFGDWDDPLSESSDVLVGSRWFAKHQPPGYQPLYAVLFDMVGDRDLQIHNESYSITNAPEVVQRVWQTAADLGYRRYFPSGPGEALTDDHIPLQQAGIRAIDVIDFDYGPQNAYWHTTDDTIDKVSAGSLQIVGDVAVALVRQ